MKRALQIFGLLILFLSISLTRAIACSCVPIAPCEAYNSSDVVFIGKAIGGKKQITVDDFSGYDGSVKTPYKPKKVIYDVGEIYFQIEKAFRGIEKISRITIHAGESSAACGYTFKHGETYLVYADKNKKGELWTGLCSRTQLVSNAEEDLAFLTNPPTPGAGATILGTVDGTVEFLQGGEPITSTKIKIQQIGGEEKVFYASLDTDGKYEILVPVGRYKVMPDIPSYLKADLDDSESETITVKDRECANVMFWIENNSSVKGKVLDADGKPVKNLTLYLATTDTEESDYKWSYVDDEGNFEFTGVSLGSYILSVNYPRLDDEVPFPAVFYPNVQDKSQAKVFKIDYGTKVENLVFNLPPQLIKRKVYGVVIGMDGKPVAGAEVSLMKAGSSFAVKGQEIRTNSKGEFVLEAYESREYYLSATLWKKTGKSKFYVSVAAKESKPFMLEEKTQTFRLVLEKYPHKTKTIITTRAN